MQMVMLQNTMASRWDMLKPRYLKFEEVIPDEVKDLQILCTNPHFAGPFASTFFESNYAWRRYLPYGVSNEDLELFERASRQKYWEKYIGMYDHDPHIMGQIVHSISIIGAGWFGELTDTVEPASPGMYIPSYIQALAPIRKDAQVLVVGAFSPHSIADLRALRQFAMVTGDFTITDLEDGITKDAATHYSLPFMVSDFYDLKTKPLDVIMTDHLVPWLVAEWDTQDVVEKRENFFRAAYERLARNGKLVMIESPIIDEASLAEISFDLQSSLDKRAIETQLMQIGFRYISVKPAKSLRSRKAVNRYLLSGRFPLEEVEVKAGGKLSYLITGTK
jgi:hypothetical protein